MNNKYNNGFTLVELAIVLVIIGLIVGGVLAGQDLIRGAELRSIVADKEKIQAAVHTFRNKYNALPGDMRNATDIWGVADADPDPNVCFGAITGVGATCNGNGNAQIADYGVETFVFYHHLINANLIEASWRTTDLVTLASNLFHPKWLPNSFYFVSYMGRVPSTDPDNYEGLYDHGMGVLGMADDGGGGLEANMQIMMARDVQHLDIKFDDGRAGLGNIIAPKEGGADAPDCATDDDPALAEYDLTQTTPECTVIFKRAL